MPQHTFAPLAGRIEIIEVESAALADSVQLTVLADRPGIVGIQGLFQPGPFKFQSFFEIFDPLLQLIDSPGFRFRWRR